ncbi:hypothetical protein NFI96_004408 [Prochilodus magdalenae]|nr:hypothetical protein NFI96_004408 [Prochilodus magdalenae]
MQDNARPRVAGVCQQFLQDEGIEAMDWPTRSPDLNLIEHIWDIMSRSIHQCHVAPQTVQELVDALVQQRYDYMKNSRELFTLTGPRDDEEHQSGSAVTLSCHLSPELSAVTMEIRWFKETDCVCLYKNRQVTEGRGYEGRVGLFTQELQRGNVSLQIRHCRESDAGDYLCQVTNGDTTEECTVGVWARWLTIMKTMERLLLNHLRPQVHHAEDPVHFASRDNVGVEDAILYLLHRRHHSVIWVKGVGAVRVMFFDFSVDSKLPSITNSAPTTERQADEDGGWTCTWSPGSSESTSPGRPQHVRIKANCSSGYGDQQLQGAPQGDCSISSPVHPVHIGLSNTTRSYATCRSSLMTTAIVGCVRNGQEREYRSLVKDFVEWCTTKPF